MPPIKLWPHQREAISALDCHFAGGGSRMVVTMPTGSGKTVTACAWVAEQVKLGSRGVILVDRVELLKQWERTLWQFGIEPGLIVANSRSIPPAKQGVWIGMVETFHRRVRSFPEFQDFVQWMVIDECHRGNFVKVLEGVEAKVVGLSATPLAAKLGRPLEECYEKIVVPVGLGDLIEDGCIVPAVTFSIEDYDWSRLRMRGGEYTEESLYAEFSKPRLYEGAVENYLRHSKGKKFLCFDVNVEHSKLMAEAFAEAGVNVHQVDGNTPALRRDEMFEDFAKGAVEGICNVGIATTGFDEPTVECVILNKKVARVSTYIQMVGRGARRCQEIGKKSFDVIDMGQNYLAHGLFGMEIDWEFMFSHPELGLKRLQEGLGPMKECPSCGALMWVQTLVCPGCGEEDERLQEGKEMDSAETVEIKAALLEAKRRERMESLPEELKGLSFSEMSEEQLKVYAEHMGRAEKLLKFFQSG